MTTAKEEYGALYGLARDVDDPAFQALSYFLERSEETDPLALTDEFVENEDRPYITKSQLEEDLGLGGAELDQALDELTGEAEHTGYLESNDHTRRSGYHEPHDRMGQLSDGDVRRMTEYKRKVDAESPEELSFRLGEKTGELEELIERLEEEPEAGEVYKFISEYEDRDSTEHGYPETEGVPLSELKEEFGEQVTERISVLKGSLSDEASFLQGRSVSPKALYDRVRGEPEPGLKDAALIKLGLESSYSEQDLEAFEGDGAKLYRTNGLKEEDPVVERLIEEVTT